MRPNFLLLTTTPLAIDVLKLPNGEEMRGAVRNWRMVSRNTVRKIPTVSWGKERERWMVEIDNLARTCELCE